MSEPLEGKRQGGSMDRRASEGMLYGAGRMLRWAK